MTDGATNLEQRIEKFESLLREMREETREAHSTLKEMRKERREIERLLSSKEIRELVNERVNAVVKTELEKIGPEIRERTNLIYERVGQQIDHLIDLALGKEFTTVHGREDIRPQLAEKLGQWIREILDKEGYGIV